MENALRLLFSSTEISQVSFSKGAPNFQQKGVRLVSTRREGQLPPVAPPLYPPLVEDEINFIVTFPLFAKEREAMLNPICAKFSSIKMLSEKNIFIWLLSQEDIYCLEMVGKFCSKAFLIRDRTLKLVIYN